MDLKEFVRETLAQIVEGVNEAQKLAVENGGAVNPVLKSVVRGDGSNFIGAVESGHLVFPVHFDVALISAEGSEVTGDAKISVASVFSLGGGGKTGSSEQSTSRIQFVVPIALPLDLEAKAAAEEKAAARADRERRDVPPAGGKDSWMR